MHFRDVSAARCELNSFSCRFGKDVTLKQITGHRLFGLWFFFLRIDFDVIRTCRRWLDYTSTSNWSFAHGHVLIWPASVFVFLCFLKIILDGRWTARPVLCEEDEPRSLPQVLRPSAVSVDYQYCVSVLLIQASHCGTGFLHYSQDCPHAKCCLLFEYCLILVVLEYDWWRVTQAREKQSDGTFTRSIEWSD